MAIRLHAMRLTVTFLVFMAALALRLAAAPWMGGSAPFFSFFLANMLVSYLYGKIYGFIVIALGLLGGHYVLSLAQVDSGDSSFYVLGAAYLVLNIVPTLLLDRLLQSLEKERQARIEAERSRGEAEQANQMKDRFLTILSHELRTPLNAILGWIRLISLGQVVELDDQKRANSAIRNNANALKIMVDDLVDVSRIVSGKVRMNFRDTDMLIIVQHAIEVVEADIREKNLELYFHTTEISYPVHGDEERLKQVCWNLLCNAVKFTPPRGRIDITLAHSDSHVVLAVCDSGAGISSEFLDKVFDRFSQQEGLWVDQKSAGLGIGLSIVKYFVEQHGGRIVAASGGVGKGACFTVYLPASAMQGLSAI